MKMKVFILSNCGTCQRILKEVNWKGEIQNIKEKNIDKTSLDKAAKALGSYEDVFSKRAMKYRSLGLNTMQLKDKDYRKYILEEYTFLKRPVFFIGDKVFAGNAKKTVAAVKEALSVAT